jgi:hypothetical protein
MADLMELETANTSNSGDFMEYDNNKHVSDIDEVYSVLNKATIKEREFQQEMDVLSCKYPRFRHMKVEYAIGTEQKYVDARKEGGENTWVKEGESDEAFVAKFKEYLKEKKELEQRYYFGQSTR